jgi:hypothetical protein
MTKNEKILLEMLKKSLELFGSEKPNIIPKPQVPKVQKLTKTKPADLVK